MSVDQMGAGQRPAPRFPEEQTGWDSREVWKPVLTEVGGTPRGGRTLPLVPAVPVGLLSQLGGALLPCDLLEDLCSLFTFVHFSGLKGLPDA